MGAVNPDVSSDLTPLRQHRSPQVALDGDSQRARHEALDETVRIVQLTEPAECWSEQDKNTNSTFSTQTLSCVSCCRRSLFFLPFSVTDQRPPALNVYWNIFNISITPPPLEPAPPRQEHGCFLLIKFLTLQTQNLFSSTGAAAKRLKTHQKGARQSDQTLGAPCIPSAHNTIIATTLGTHTWLHVSGLPAEERRNPALHGEAHAVCHPSRPVFTTDSRHLERPLLT